MEIVPIVDGGNDTRVHRAGWVAVDAFTVIENGFVRVEKGKITGTGVYGHGMGEKVVDHGPGLLMPAFVNAHTHLELSALKGKLSWGKGFGLWVKELLEIRDSLGKEGLIKGLGQGVAELTGSGCLVVGDISSLGIVGDYLKTTDLSGVVFREYLGNGIPEPALEKTWAQLNVSWAGHAPHTSSPGLLVDLKNRCRKDRLVFSIHLAESADEMEFITTGKGSWADFLQQRGIDSLAWGLPWHSPVQYLDRLGLLDEKTLAVHVIHADHTDIRILKQRGASVCLCPRSNMNLHGTLPPVTQMIEADLPLCLGTDSLASTESLNILDDMVFLSRRFPMIPAEKIFHMATAGGARALGLEGLFGSLGSGKKACMIYVPVKTKTKQTLFESILS